MAKTSVKFQNDWPKTVGGVALTSQLLTDKRTGLGTPILHLRAHATKIDDKCPLRFGAKRVTGTGYTFRGNNSVKDIFASLLSKCIHSP